MDSQEIEFVVRGRIGPDLIAALDGFSVSHHLLGRTRVVGAVLDQSQMLGILAMFDEMHIDVISVNPVAADPR
ncbi:hypothetical protein N3K63_12420 [Microbacterium sp. W1N]|uniref:hypothetical protein n=1 Tax=Microbacterium festucae TaxID=2977531 RepID=UPI0021C051A9|nr:hypothetical protein [Microbacterium festucae]MCT9821083.1 hypothetical protein [Microbacterium festucae]